MIVHSPRWKTYVPGWAGQLTRVVLPAVLTVALSVCAVYLLAVPAIEDNVMVAKQDTMRKLTETAWQLLSSYEERVSSGELTLEEAQARAIDRIRSLRYGPEGKDYFWINDMHPRMVMHPYRNDLEGQDLSEFTDPRGKRLFVEFANTVRETGAGYVDYWWQWKDDRNRIVSKLSYVRGFEPWGWIIGTGIYLDDVGSEIAAITSNLNRAFAGIIVVIVALSAYIVWYGRARERKRAEAERDLRTSEERFRRLAENAKDMIYRMSLPDGRYEYVSPASVEILGYTPEELYESPILIKKIMHPDWQDYFAEQWEALLAGRMPPSYEYQIIHKSGDVRWLYQRNVLVKDPDDQPCAIEGIVTDITKRKAAEEEREKLRAQLHHSQKLEAVGQLAGGVAHDFNNILTAIMGNVELALAAATKPIPGEFLTQGLHQIERSAQRATGLTRQLLAFSRRQVTQPVILDLNQTLSEMEKMLRRLLTENINIKFELAPSLKFIRADASQVEQVIMNLAINAGDAMPDGGELTIRTSMVTLEPSELDEPDAIQPGEYIRLTVSDIGVGMSKEVIEKIFNPFFTTKAVGSGTGLGLATVYGIIKQAGGRITVTSQPQQGTTFTIELPVAPAETHAPRHSVRTEAPTGAETILVCEDDDTVRHLATRMLQDGGYTVLAARHGGEALELAADYNGPIHLLISDVIMPGMNGKKLSTTLAAAMPEMKTLFVSGYTDDVIAHHGVLDAGVQFLEKPFNRQSLLQRVREVLDGPIETTAVSNLNSDQSSVPSG